FFIWVLRSAKTEQVEEEEFKITQNSTLREAL
ncbi:MAG: NADH:ubiquinone reductase (Na(+)-transporting) subunit D, partial [Pseudomonadales bacterium]